MSSDVGAVVIGRNEGERLVRCLASHQHSLGPVVYVDRGSTDDSLRHAVESDALVVERMVSQAERCKVAEYS